MDILEALTQMRAFYCSENPSQKWKKKKHDFHTSHTLAPWQHFEALATSLVKGHKDDRANARAFSKRFSSTSANHSNTIPSMSVFCRTSKVCDRASWRPWSLLGIQCLPAKVAVLNWYNYLPGFKHVEIICYLAIPARLRRCTFFLRTGIKSILAICPVSWKIFNQFISVPGLQICTDWKLKHGTLWSTSQYLFFIPRDNCGKLAHNNSKMIA